MVSETAFFKSHYAQPEPEVHPKYKHVVSSMTKPSVLYCQWQYRPTILLFKSIYEDDPEELKESTLSINQR
jgi:hypothetical protein